MTYADRPANMQVRCKNCVSRFDVKKGEMLATCPNCGTKWNLSWPKPDLPYIRNKAA
jgi:predicted  nucleic acid-binding Zn-ribbon protein